MIYTGKAASKERKDFLSTTAYHYNKFASKCHLALDAPLQAFCSSTFVLPTSFYEIILKTDTKLPAESPLSTQSSQQSH